MSNVKDIKARIREKVWRTLEEKNIALFPRPVYHRIPNFVGADVAARRLSHLDVFMKARVVKVNPDSPQKHVRYLALLQNKIVIMPTPRIRNGFILLDPLKIPRDKIAEASTISGAYRYGSPVDLLSLPKIDLVVIGSVAVNASGARLGKGEGYAEIEYAILRSLCKIDENTYVVTTVHDEQVVDDYIPIEEHDVGVDIIVTPTKTISIIPRPRKPKGIIWDILPDKKFIEIPILKELRTILKNEKAITCN
ncbi:MAG: 5-formyltetrahydrofolate cyclo-ligase [Ignisphaera sp.]